MTVADLARLVVRHWLVTVLALLGIALGCRWAALAHTAVNGTVAVIFLAPTATDDNVLAGTTAALVDTAGVVAERINGPVPPMQPVGNVTLASQGVKQGWSAHQPNNGGQWVTHFSDPLIDVDSTGPNAAAAQAEMQEALAAVDQALAEVQDDAGVPESARIVTFLNPASPVYTVQSSSPIRSLGAVVLLGMLVWAWGLFTAERFRLRRLARPRRVAAAA